MINEINKINPKGNCQENKTMPGTGNVPQKQDIVTLSASSDKIKDLKESKNMKKMGAKEMLQKTNNLMLETTKIRSQLAKLNDSKLDRNKKEEGYMDIHIYKPTEAKPGDVWGKMEATVNYNYTMEAHRINEKGEEEIFKDVGYIYYDAWSTKINYTKIMESGKKEYKKVSLGKNLNTGSYISYEESDGVNKRGNSIERTLP